MNDMDLVVIFQRAFFQTKDQGDDRHQVGNGQLPEILIEGDNKSHYQEVREIEEVFSRLQSLHIIHDDQVQVEVDNGQYARQSEFFPHIQVIGEDKNIRRGKVDKGADIQPETKVGDDADEIGQQGQDNELVEADDLLPLVGGEGFVQPPVDDVLVKGPGSR